LPFSSQRCSACSPDDVVPVQTGTNGNPVAAPARGGG
jgi:hypothetical protein